jgi:SAM-dependent methyltransferase
MSLVSSRLRAMPGKTTCTPRGRTPSGSSGSCDAMRRRTTRRRSRPRAPMISCVRRGSRTGTSNISGSRRSPRVLIRRGLGVAPEARWIGGFAHVLPFENDTFDVVCCNAARHHMRHVPAAMHEMLRILKPDGWLLTSGDPFRADHGNDDVELDVFDEHPAVLLGVNESVPTFGRLVETLVAHESRLDVELHTLALFGIRGRVTQLRRGCCASGAGV